MVIEERKEKEYEFHESTRDAKVIPPQGAFYTVTRSSYSYLMGEMKQALPSGKVLDYCCGIGGHTRNLARAGYDAWGIDLSPISIENSRYHAIKGGKVFSPCYINRRGLQAYRAV